MTATRTRARRRRMTLSSMESLGFIDTPALVSSTPRRPQPPPPVAETRLVRRGRHLAPTGDPVRDLWDTTVLDSPSLERWTPASEGVTRLTGRDFRWTLLALTGAVLLIALGLGYWLYDSSAGTEDGIGLELRGQASALDQGLDELRRVAMALPQAADPSEPAYEALSSVDQAARALFDELSELPPGHPARSDAAASVELALEAVRSIRETSVFSTALGPVLIAPDFETDPTLIDITTATEDVLGWRAGLEAVVDSLPSGTDGAAITWLQSMDQGLNRFQQDYLDALADRDAAAAMSAVAALEGFLEDTRSRLVLEVSQRTGEVVALIERASALLSPLLG